MDQAEPYLVAEDRVADLRAYLSSAGAAEADINISTARGVADVVDALKARLAFPEWCASGWDSIEDAFEELRQAWSFPLALIIRGLPSVLGADLHLGLQTVVRLSALSAAFSVAGDQLLVVYVRPM